MTSCWHIRALCRKQHPTPASRTCFAESTAERLVTRRVCEHIYDLQRPIRLLDRSWQSPGATAPACRGAFCLPKKAPEHKTFVMPMLPITLIIERQPCRGLGQPVVCTADRAATSTRAYVNNGQVSHRAQLPPVGPQWNHLLLSVGLGTARSESFKHCATLAVGQ